MKKYGDGPATTHWNEVCSETDTTNEELTLRNTFVNATIGELVQWPEEV